MSAGLLRKYYRLAKPGIIYGNLVTTAGGFLLASKGHINFGLFLATALGISLVIGSACVFNNILDRNIDAKMARTKNRALVTGEISKSSAMIFGRVLILIGGLILARYTNLLTVLIALVGFFVYVALYSPLKRHSVHATLVGAVAGAVPPVVGYCAVTNNLDAGAAILFLILVFWQMPHFFAIAIYRLNDYSAASIPVLPVKRGIFFTKINMLLYITGFIIAAISLGLFGYVGRAYLAVVVALGLIWLGLCLKGFSAKTEDKPWARKMFLYSLVVITLLCVMLSLDAALK